MPKSLTTHKPTQLHRRLFSRQRWQVKCSLGFREKSTKPIKLLQTACAAQSICSALWFQESNIYLLDFSLVLVYTLPRVTLYCSKHSFTCRWKFLWSEWPWMTQSTEYKRDEGEASVQTWPWNRWMSIIKLLQIAAFWITSLYAKLL